MILAQLSDPHVLVGPGDRGSAESLAAGVAAVLALRPRPDAVLVSGTSPTRPRRRSTSACAICSRRCRCPSTCCRATTTTATRCAAHFPLEGEGEYRFVADVGGVRLVVCDSTIPGRPEGRLDVGWLEAQLAAPAVVVAMHHPPFGVGMPALDEIALGPEDTAALAALLGAARRSCASPAATRTAPRSRSSAAAARSAAPACT